MSTRIGAVIGLIFALVWLSVGVRVMSVHAMIVCGTIGIVAIAAAGVRAWRRPAGSGRFDRKWYWIAVAGELAAMLIIGALFDFGNTPSVIWSVIGVIVGLHFVGLWRAAHDRRFLWLAGGMTTLNLIALFLPPGPLMQMVSGFGSSAAIALAVAA